MSQAQNDNDPMNFVRGLWGNMGFSLPGMVAPTLDTDDIGKQIEDLKAVEGWLRMNLSMLQMTIQNLEMQRTTISAVQAMGLMATEASQSDASSEAVESISQAAMWPWAMVQQMQEQAAAQTAANAAAAAAAKKTAAEKKPPAKAKPANATERAVRGSSKKSSK